MVGEGFERFEAPLERASRALGDRTIWHVNSTARGGGVAEMLDRGDRGLRDREQHLVVRTGAAVANGISGYKWPRPAVLVNRIRRADSEKTEGAIPLTTDAGRRRGSAWPWFSVM